MALIESLKGRRIYIDANLFIYLVEANHYPQYKLFTRTLFGMIDAGECEAFTSELTLGEVLVGPMRSHLSKLVDIYRQLLSGSENMDICPVTINVIDAAAALRAVSSLKMPDALHVATALHHGCTHFVTNDKKLKVPNKLPISIVLLSDF